MLTIEAEKPISESLKDSLQLQTNFKDYLSLKQQVDTLPLQLQKMGYVDSRLEKFEALSDTVYTSVFFFGKKYESIKIYYSEENFSKKELSKVASEITDAYFILPFETLEQSLQKLNSLKTENGNAFARLRLTNISKEEDGNLSASITLISGRKRIIDSIAIKGYEKFPRSFITYVAGVKKGKTFNQKKIVAQNEILNSLPFASTIKAPQALFRKDSTVVYFYLEKRNANIFDGVLGFATDEETNKLQFNGYLNLELNNNLNYGEQLAINYKADGEDQRDFKVRLKLPYILKSPFGVGLELKIFKQDSTFTTTDQQAKVYYQINPASSAYLGYKGYESSNLLDNVVVGSPIEDYDSKFLIAGIDYFRSQKSTLFPIKSQISLDTEIGSRKLKNSSDSQLRFLSEVSHIFNLNFKNSLFLKNNSSILISDTYFVNELFRFGGIGTIRGFNENSIDASFFTILNTEYRYQFNEGLYLHSIIDLGYFENDSMNLKEKLYSYGLGIGLLTKAGILRLNIANGNRENQDFKFSNTKIHIMLTSRF